jgi:hypothetical protein
MAGFAACILKMRREEKDKRKRYIKVSVVQDLEPGHL